MERSKRLVIRLSLKEQETVTELAASEKLPPSTLARRLLLQAADKRRVTSLPNTRTTED